MLSRENILSLLQTNKKSLMEKYPINKMALFGSYSRKDNNLDSDVDILVDFNEQIGIRFIDLADELSEILGKNVDLVSSKAIKDKYFKEIERDLLYV
ncbi:MAG: nucleotidyltransferase family protein [Candidatus Kapabacteria bacterium]|nr:nucleotidyltransferase family protein [Ignavibacteriota bacterium]MCW5884807.1 nucleotidyltransferase family protein [Candidatus Kapabacteria bacterium]